PIPFPWEPARHAGWPARAPRGTERAPEAGGMATDQRAGRGGLGRWAPRAFFACHLLLGLVLVRDYGLSFDEPCQRWGCGVVNRRFLVHGDRRGLLRCSEKYHGPAFELVLVFA